MDQNVKSDMGTIRIHKKVISSIAIIAAKEVEGVVRIGSSIKSILFSSIKQNPVGAIEVDIDSNSNDVSLVVPIVISYGYNLPEVANRVQENIRKMVEKSTDLNIKQIDVNIQAVEREAKK
jgi:uncharacterized alkaline shock family protein YloU